MNPLIPALAALLQSASFTMDKALLSIRRIDWQAYTTISFPLLCIVDIVLFIVFRPPLSWSLFTGTTGLFLGATVLMAFVTNALYYRALDDNYLHEMQTWALVPYIPTIILAGILFADERNWTILIPALVASAAAVWSSMDRGKLVIRKKTLPFVGWMLVSAPVVAAMTKVILDTWHPINLELVRDASLSIMFLGIYGHRIPSVSRRAWRFFLGTNVLSAVSWVLFYVGYQQFGVVYTLMLFSLQPLLTYFMSAVFLKEPFVPRKFVAFLVIVASIAVAQVLR